MSRQAGQKCRLPLFKFAVVSTAELLAFFDHLVKTLNHSQKTGNDCCNVVLASTIGGDASVLRFVGFERNRFHYDRDFERSVT